MRFIVLTFIFGAINFRVGQMREKREVMKILLDTGSCPCFGFRHRKHYMLYAFS